VRRWLLLGALVAAAPAWAERLFAVAYESSAVSNENVELESWLDFAHPAAEDHKTYGQQNLIWWLGARAGITRDLELAGLLLFEQKFQRLPGFEDEETSKFLEAILEAKYSFKDPADEGFKPFVMFQLIKWTEADYPVQFHLIAGADRRFGKVLVAANASYWDSTEFRTAAGHKRWVWGEAELAASYAVSGDEGEPPSLSIGAEVWGVGVMPQLGGPPKSHGHVHLEFAHGGGVYVGPTVAARKGRVWATFNLSFSVAPPPERSPDPQPGLARLIVGIQL
jgi:hypothetical protein